MYVQHKGVMSGVIRCLGDINLEEAGLFSLDVAFTKSFASCNDVILVFGGFAIAIQYERKKNVFMCSIVMVEMKMVFVVTMKLLF